MKLNEPSCNLLNSDVLGQLRLSERTSSYQPATRSRTPTTLDPVVARLGIDTKQEKPSLLARGPNYAGGDSTSKGKHFRISPLVEKPFCFIMESRSKMFLFKPSVP